MLKYSIFGQSLFRPLWSHQQSAELNEWKYIFYIHLSNFFGVEDNYCIVVMLCPS